MQDPYQPHAQAPQWTGQVLSLPVDIGVVAVGRGRGRGMQMAGDAAMLAQGGILPGVGRGRGFPLPSIPNAAASAPPAVQPDLQPNPPTGQSEANQDNDKDVPKCPLHKKPNGKCKFCQKHAAFLDRKLKKKEEAAQDAVSERKETSEKTVSTDRFGPIVFANKKTYGFPPLLQTHVLESTHFKSLASASLDDVIQECCEYANCLEPYLRNPPTQPSGLFVCLYRFFTLGIEGHDLQRLLDSRESPFVRCAGALFVRYGLPHDKMWGWLEEYVLDEEEFRQSDKGKDTITIGEYVAGLLTQDKYFEAVLPRLPAATQRQIQEKLAPVEQWRQRAQQNTTILDSFRALGTRVEAIVQGEWRRGKIARLLENSQTGIKVRVRMEDGSEVTSPLGKVILQDSTDEGWRSRSRSPRRGSNREENLSYDRGRSDAQLIADVKDRERNKAVVGSGKHYAKRVTTFNVLCALPGDQGSQTCKLVSEEFAEGTSSGRRQQQSEQQVERPKMSREEEFEHKKRMQAIMEKYGSSKSAASQSSAGLDLIDAQDTLRLG